MGAMSLESLIDMIYGNLFWLAVTVFIAIIIYVIYASLEKG